MELDCRCGFSTLQLVPTGQRAVSFDTFTDWLPFLTSHLKFSRARESGTPADAAPIKLVMPKRKASESEGGDRSPESPSKRHKSSKQRSLEGVLDNGKKALYRALQVSRGFERQKLGRRQKTAKEQHATADTARLASEVTALKVSAPTTYHTRLP